MYLRKRVVQVPCSRRIHALFEPCCRINTFRGQRCRSTALFEDPIHFLDRVAGGSSSVYNINSLSFSSFLFVREFHNAGLVGLVLVCIV